MLLDAMGLMGRATRISSSTDVAVVLAFAVVCVAAFDPRETLSVLPTYMAAIPLCFAVPAGFFCHENTKCIPCLLPLLCSLFDVLVLAVVAYFNVAPQFACYGWRNTGRSALPVSPPSTRC